MNRTPENGMDGLGARGVHLLSHHQPLVGQLFTDSGAASWRLPRDVFAAALELGARKRFGEEAPGAVQIEEYLSRLHLQDLALGGVSPEATPAAWIISSRLFAATCVPRLALFCAARRTSRQ